MTTNLRSVARLLAFSIASSAAIASGQDVGNSGARCDFAKCADGWCWALDPAKLRFRCTDGYVAHNMSSDSAAFLFTCCPEGSVPPTCSEKFCTSPSFDPRVPDCWADAINQPMTCSGEDGFRYPHKTGRIYMDWSHYVCCTSPSGKNEHRQDISILEGFRLAISLIGFVCTVSLLLGILTCRSVRSQQYNLYVVGLAIPDAIYSGAQSMEAIFFFSRHVYPTALKEPVFYFCFLSNVSINCIVTYKILSLLVASSQRRRIQQPTTWSVCASIAIAYLVAMVWAILRGLVVFGHISNPSAAGISWEVWVGFAVVMVVCLYMAYVCLRIWMQKLLPLNGRTRGLALYFFRVVITFFVFWIPAFIIGLVIGSGKISDNMVYSIMYISVIQSIGSFAAALTKPDVRKAVAKFWLCRKDDRSADVEEDADVPPIGESAWKRFVSSLSKASGRRSTFQTELDNSKVPSVVDEKISASKIESHFNDEPNEACP